MNSTNDIWRQPDRRLTSRWYNLIMVIFSGMGVVFIALGSLVIGLMPRSPEAMIGFGIQALGCIVMVINAIWAIYFYTWFHSGDPLVLWKKTPKAFAAGLRIAVLMVPMVIGGTALGLTIIVIVLSLFPPVDVTLDFQVLKLMVVLFLLTAFWYGLSLPYTKKLTSRVRSNAIDRRVCFECGYDLHACVTPLCPECGESIPWLAGGVGGD